MAEIRNLLFDYGNVIIDLDIEGCKSNMAKLIAEEKTGEETFDFLMELIKKHEVGSISDDLFINGVLKHAHHKVQALDVIEAWNSMLVGIPPYRLTMLEQLRQKYSVVLLSNTNQIHLEWTHRHLQSSHGEHHFEKRLFDDVFYSHQIGLRKPSAECFEHVCKEAFLTPKHTLFIDDMPENIAAANELGFQTHHSPADEEIAEWLKVEGFY